MKFLIGLLMLSPAAQLEQPPRETCESDDAIGGHMVAVQQVLDDLRAGDDRQFRTIVPPGLSIFTPDFSSRLASQTARPLTADYFTRLFSSGSYRVEGRKTIPGLMCGSVVVMWSRPDESEPYWMTALVFQEGRLTYASEVDLSQVRKFPPVIVSTPAP